MKAHPFFATIDWKALEAKAIHPPFVPVVSSAEDFRNFDKTFTGEEVTDTPSVTNLEQGKGKEAAYDNFTYARPELLAKKPEE